MWFRFILEQFPEKLMEYLSLTIYQSPISMSGKVAGSRSSAKYMIFENNNMHIAKVTIRRHSSFMLALIASIKMRRPLYCFVITFEIQN
jgi:hypothetical protein